MTGKLGPYEILEPLGAGGMGEVYRAHDPDLKRDVAIKMLPAELASDRDRLARLEREAHLLAALNHPNVATIHGLEEAEADDGLSSRFLVLELVEGETLQERLRSGPFEAEEALEIAAQIARGLEAAHEKGIIHRDLKPGNVKITPDGLVKVLDFGLAKPSETAGAEADAEDLTRSPTATVAGTEAGVILGTAAYMSPEQARGKEVDQRTDIWSFGCVLYEMLAGRRPFAGEDASETLASILKDPVDWGELPSSISPTVASLLRRCLRKDPARRLHHIVDVRIEVDEALAETTRVAPGATGVAAPDGPASPETGPAVVGVSRRQILFAGAVAAGLGAGAGLAVDRILSGSWWGASGRPAPVHVSAMLPPGVSVRTGPGNEASSVALSPDGRTLVIAGVDDDGQRLYVRRLDGGETTTLPGTAGAGAPFFSPEGDRIGFYADGRIKQVPVDGGVEVELAVVPGAGHPTGASWLSAERIAFGAGTRSPLFVASVADGRVETLTTLDTEAGEVSHVQPEILPDGRTLLFVSGGWIHAFDLESEERSRIVQGVAPRYAYTGHLVFCRGAQLLAARFDPSRPHLVDDDVPLIDGVAERDGISRHYAIARNGTLAYVPATVAHALVLRSPDDRERLVTEERRTFENPQFSPDGQRLAVAAARRANEPLNIWIHDLEGGTVPRQLTFDHGRAPVWTPDGSAVTFSHLGERQGIYNKVADGSGAAEQVVAIDEFHWLIGWTPDERTLAYGVMEGPMDDAISRSSLMAFAGGESRRVVGPANLWGGRLSPDGRWLAYYSGDPGRFDVYLTDFPGGATKYLIAENGRDPSWGPEGPGTYYLYYRSGDRLLAVQIETEGGVQVRSPDLVTEPFYPPLFDDYDVHPLDGRTLVMVRAVDATQGRQVDLVFDWFTELQERAAP